MKTRRIIAIVVSVLLLLAILLLFADPWSMFRRHGARIVLRDPAAVDGIALWSSSDSVRLTRAGDTWYLDGRTPVAPKAVENLLYAASRLSISSSLPASLLPADAARRRVRFLSGGRILLEYTFLSAGDRYLVRPAGSDLAYYVTLPGYAGMDLDLVFTERTGHYLDQVLIDMLPSEIAMIRIEKEGHEPFLFTQDSTGAIACYLQGVEERVPDGMLKERVPDGMLKELPVRLLFSYFTSIRFESRSGVRADSLTGPGGPGMMARLQVRSFSGEEHTLRIFPYREQPGDEPHMFLALVVFDDEPAALVVNYIYLDVLMRGPSHYLVLVE